LLLGPGVRGEVKGSRSFGVDVIVGDSLDDIVSFWEWVVSKVCVGAESFHGLVPFSVLITGLLFA